MSGVKIEVVWLIWVANAQYFRKKFALFILKPMEFIWCDKQIQVNRCPTFSNFFRNFNIFVLVFPSLQNLNNYGIIA